MIRRLFAAAILLLPLSASAAEVVRFKTRDGQTLVGDFHPPAAGKKTIILMHGLGANRREWRPLTAVLEKSGWGYLAFDLRGHADSSSHRDKAGEPDGYKYFGAPGPGSSWERMIDDVGAAVRFLETERKVAHDSIAVGGASLGANVAMAFVGLTRSLPALVLLSPGLDYQGIRTEPAASRMKGTPVLLISHPADRYAYVSCKRLKALMPSATFWSDVKAGHGAQMFDETLLQRIVTWLESAK